jgi:hypothetical protein
MALDSLIEVKDLVTMLDRHDKTKDKYDWNARDNYLAEKVNKYSEKEYDELTEIIATHWSTTDDCNDEHGSIVMDIMCTLVFLLEDYKRFDFLVEDIEQSNLRDLLIKCVEAIKEVSFLSAKDFKDGFTNVYDRELADKEPTKEEVNA